MCKNGVKLFGKGYLELGRKLKLYGERRGRKELELDSWWLRECLSSFCEKRIFGGGRVFRDKSFVMLCYVSCMLFLFLKILVKVYIFFSVFWS